MVRPLSLEEKIGAGVSAAPQQPSDEKDVHYFASPTMARFHRSRKFFRGVRGPVGSGKTTGVAWDLFMAAHQVPAGADGVRRTRVLAIRNCYDDQTEVLTERRGFVLFRDLRCDDRVAMLQDGKTVWTQPSYYYAAPYVGEMVGCRNEGVDCLVTPDHRMWVSRARTRKKVWGDYEFAKAEEVYGNGDVRVRRDADWDGVDPGRSPAFFEWLGFWFAEGSSGVYHCADGYTRHQCVITQKRSRDYVHGLFRRAGLPYTVASRADGGSTFRLSVTPQTKPIITELSGQGHAVDKWLPQWVREAPREHIRAFIQGYSAGDGYRKGSTSFIVTSSRVMADQLQELALKAGYVANVGVKQKAAGVKAVINGVETQSTSPCYTVTFVGEAKHQPRLKAQGYAGRYPGWYRQNYAGMVYCIEVPTHVIYVRRNGKAMWCGQTYAELKSTTIQTWEHWFGPERGPGHGPIVYDAPIRQTIRRRLDDGTTMELQMWFIALDRPAHVRKLKSLEVTWVWLNEASEIGEEILEMATTRAGRYPHADQAPPDHIGDWPVRYGIVADTNSMDDDHWWYWLAEEERPDGYAFFDQPSGLAEGAENIAHLPGGRHYYTQIMAGKSDDWIRVYVENRYGHIQDGKPIYPEFNDQLHVRPKPIPAAKGLDLLLGFDFGLTPACVIGQWTPRGQLRVISELVVDIEQGTMGIRRFAETVVLPYLAMHYRGMNVMAWGDPGGNSRVETDEETCIDVLNDVGIPAEPAHTNVFEPRRDAVSRLLRRLGEAGEPALVLSPECLWLRKAMAGRYQYRRLQVAGEKRYVSEPDKNKWSHVAEALQYLALGATAELGSARRRVPHQHLTRQPVVNPYG